MHRVGIRRDGREPEDLRPIAFTRDFTEFAAGSVLVEFGRTHVLCTASVETRVPPWLRGQGRGWVTAEYSMLPGSTQDRVEREAQKGRPSGRTQEIQRLIGRSLRAVTDLHMVGEVQITVDCDVLQADGGTRTASICGGYVALHDACTRLVQSGTLAEITARRDAAIRRLADRGLIEPGTATRALTTAPGELALTLAPELQKSDPQRSR